MFVSRVTTCLVNLEMLGNLTAVREMSGILLKIREMSGKQSCQERRNFLLYTTENVLPNDNVSMSVGHLDHVLIVREKFPKTVYCKLRICVLTGI